MKPSQENEIFSLLGNTLEESLKLIELLKEGGDPNVKNSGGQTPLAVAINQRNFRCATILLENRADTNISYTDPQTKRMTRPLFGAIRADDMRIVKLLLARGAEVEAKEEGSNNTALTVLLSKYHLEELEPELKLPKNHHLPAPTKSYEQQVEEVQKAAEKLVATFAEQGTFKQNNHAGRQARNSSATSNRSQSRNNGAELQKLRGVNRALAQFAGSQTESSSNSTHNPSPATTPISGELTKNKNLKTTPQYYVQS